jgi:SAM-dependent methyltransferase
MTGATTGQYATPDRLAVRAALHEEYSTTRPRLPRWIFDRVVAEPFARVVEVGCGVGALWAAHLDHLPPDRRVTLTDRSPGMVAAGRATLGADRRFSFAVADAAALPFADATVDLAVANHMLYHVTDAGAAAAELARILRQGGRLLASTNGERHMTEILGALHRHGVIEHPGTPIPSFTLENGSGILGAAFSGVVLERYDDSLEITDAGAVIAYIGSWWSDAGSAALAAIESEVSREIERRGFFAVTKDVGMFTARR